jgi:hypothetical protein
MTFAMASQSFINFIDAMHNISCFYDDSNPLKSILQKISIQYQYNITHASDLFLYQFAKSKNFDRKELEKEAIKIQRYTYGGTSRQDIHKMDINSYCNLINAIVANMKDEEKQ